ncbi:hypothetical protein BH23CHL2_BH23CHL2_09130 [soil metagenome]
MQTDRKNQSMPSMISSFSQRTTSRRGLLSRSAKLAGAGALAAMAASGTLGSVLAHNERPPDCEFESDIEVLNYALTLEHLEYNFYLMGQELFGADDFKLAFSGRGILGRDLRNYGFSVNSGERINMLFNDIRDHELVHVQTLQSAITSLGGTPVRACTYDFGFPEGNNKRGRDGRLVFGNDPEAVAQYIAIAQALENTGVMAYTGAINCLLNADLIEAGATIATVEARHAAFLNLLNADSPFPAAFDTPKTKCEIFAIAAQFIVDCPDEVLALFSDC